ncbi:MAG: DNA-directed RNA polymerase subunit D [Candidatus Diapherotrites archaeon]|nr:DNA-directed RNA polymerase subunit D [Candidatus Micrarchaeota archaeon]MBU1939322.1 DNA-directed RNA polymerase subunit D [Candidatus Micrarchaeota archaeon]
MDVKKVYEKNNVVKLLVKGTDAAMMNSVRRAIMNYVPVLAAEDVSIYDNSSVIFDEFLAHRLAMIPLKSDGKGFKEGDKVKLTLDKDGPCTVYSKDLKSTDPKVEVAAKQIPIAKLDKGQKIKLEIDAVFEGGKGHAKWQPASVGYGELPLITIGKGCDLCNECVEHCAKHALEVKGKKVTLERPLDCDLCGKCRDICKSGALNLEYEKGSFLMTVDNYGNHKVKDILMKALDSLAEKTKVFRKEVSKI